MTTAKNDDFIALQLEHFGNEPIFDKWEGTLGLPPFLPVGKTLLAMLISQLDASNHVDTVVLVCQLEIKILQLPGQLVRFQNAFF